MKKQPIYVIDKASVMNAIIEAESNEKYFSLSYGISSPEDMKRMVNAIFVENEFVHVSKVANRFKALECAKMVRSADTAIEYILRQIQLMRTKEL